MSRGEVTTIGNVCSRFSSGKSILSTKINDKGLYPVFGGNGIRGYTDTYNFDGECAISGRQGAYCGNVRYFSGKAYMTEHAIVACAKPEYSTGYLAYKLSLMNLGQYQGQSAQPGLSVNTLAKVSIDMPPIAFQEKAFNCIKKLDNKIENNNRINEELALIAKTIYDYWFLQYEFPNEEGKPYKSSGGKMVWNEELEKEIPEGWKDIRLKDVFSIVKGKIPSNLLDKQTEDSHPYITIDAINGEGYKFCSSNNMPYCNGETVMVMDGAASGDIYVGCCGVLGSTLAMMKSLRADISDSLIYQILMNYKKKYKKANTGSTIPHANRKYIEEMSIPLSSDMKMFSDIFDRIQKKIIQNQKENQELCKLRVFLLPLLMSRQVSFLNSSD